MSLAKERGWEMKLPSHRSQASGVAAAAEGERPDLFSEIAFHEHLVKFIIVNDQVRSRHLFIFLCLLIDFPASESHGVSRVQRPSPPVTK